MDRSKQLGEGKISTLLLKFSIPAIIGMLVNALYNIIDRIFIGQGITGEAPGKESIGLAALTISLPAMLITMAFGMLIGIGATALVSIKLGEQKKEEAELVAGNALVLLVSISIILSVLGIVFIKPLLLFFGASLEELPYAIEYMQIIFIGTTFMSIGFGMNNFIRAEGNPKTAMFTMLIGAFLNIALDPLFIFVFGWGMRGAALATILSQGASALWVLYYFFSGKSSLRIHFSNLKLRLNIVARIMAIGAAPFAMQISASALNTIVNHSLTFYGKSDGSMEKAAFGVITSITMLILMPIFGINQGMQPIIGYNYGAQKFDRVKETLKLGILGATIITSLGFVSIQLFSNQFMAIFNPNDKELIAFGGYALRVFLIFLPLIGFQVVSANYFQAVGKPMQSGILSLSRQVLLLIPAVLILPRFWGLDGLLFAGPVADFLSCLITALWLFIEIRSLNRKHKYPMV